MLVCRHASRDASINLCTTSIGEQEELDEGCNFVRSFKFGASITRTPYTCEEILLREARSCAPDTL